MRPAFWTDCELVEELVVLEEEEVVEDTEDEDDEETAPEDEEVMVVLPLCDEEVVAELVDEIAVDDVLRVDVEVVEVLVFFPSDSAA